MEKAAWRVCDNDDVAVVLENVAAGETVICGGTGVTASAEIPQGHKIAIRAIAAGDMVKKYGVAIGEAKTYIAAGDYVHTHNLRDVTEKLCAEYDRKFREEARHG